MEAAPLVLDGGFATQLEANGISPLHPVLWSAGLLLWTDTTARDAALRKVHRQHLAAGAQILTSSTTYQFSFEQFARFGGVDASAAKRLIQHACGLAKREAAAQSRRVDVAASLGPYGAVLADGSEYTAAYPSHATIPFLTRFHKERILAVVDTTLEAERPDLLAFETVPSFFELQAILDAVCECESSVPYWISFSCTLGTDSLVKLRDGTPITRCIDFICQKNVGAFWGVGINCSKPSCVSPFLQQVRASLSDHTHILDLHLIVYPNSGEGWDASCNSWLPSDETIDLGTLTAQWISEGATVIGGCCRVTDNDISVISSTIN